MYRGELLMSHRYTPKYYRLKNTDRIYTYVGRAEVLALPDTHLEIIRSKDNEMFLITKEHLHRGFKSMSRRQHKREKSSSGVNDPNGLTDSNGLNDSNGLTDPQKPNGE